MPVGICRGGSCAFVVAVLPAAPNARFIGAADDL
jgi:hypothetical protein